MDKGTELDYIADLMTEREALLKEIRQLKADLARWSRIGTFAFTQAGGCITGCKGACMCTCGYEHYVAQRAEEAKRG
jgi:hypothetical protein